MQKNKSSQTANAFLQNAVVWEDFIYLLSNALALRFLTH